MNKSKFKQTEIGMIPENWKATVLGSEIEIIGGGTPKTTNHEYWGGNIPWISVTDFGKSRWIHQTEKHITEKGLKESSTKILHKNQVIISARGTVGEVRQIITDMAFNQSCYGIDGKNNMNNDFIYSLLKHKVKELQRQGHGAVFNTITRDTFDHIRIAMPNFKEQSAIAKILSDLDSKIELNQQMNKTLEAIGQAVFKQWFVDFEFPNEEGKPYKSSDGEMVESDLGMIPKGWNVGFLGDNILTSISKVGIEKFEGDKIYLDTASVQDSRILKFDTKITFDERPSRANMQPKPKTVWFAKMKDSKKIMFFDNYSNYGLQNFILSTGFAGLDVKDYALGYIWTYTLRDRFEVEKDNLCHGTTMQAINNENIMKMKILIPPKEVLIKFNELVEAIYHQTGNLAQNCWTLSNIRDSLLPKLMSGKIRVPVEVRK